MPSIVTVKDSCYSLLVVVLSLSLATFCPVAPAQAPPEKSLPTPPETTIVSNAELVLVPVVVRKGTEHVVGLTQADFTVLDGGRRQKLAFVKTTDTGVVLRQVAGENVFSNQIDTAGETPRVTVIVVDSANIPFADQPQVRDSFASFWPATQPAVDRLRWFHSKDRVCGWCRISPPTPTSWRPW